MAVFTPVSPDDARAFLAHYHVGALEELRAIAEGVENTNYHLRTDQNEFVLTLFEKRVRVEDLPFILGLIAHLSDKGVPAPRPIPGRDGAVTRTLNGRTAAMGQWLKGRWTLAPNADQFTAAGVMLGALHEASDDYTPTLANHFGHAEWRRLADLCGAKASGDNAAMLTALEREVDELTRAWPADLPAGPIHADYFPDNVLFVGDDIGGVIDFYFACTDMRAYDLAIAINAWCFDAAGAFLPDAATAFVGGFAQRRPLSAAERDALPLLCRGAAARFTLTRLYDVLHHDPSWAVTPKDPAPFFRRLELHQKAPGADVYGVPA